MLLCGTIYNIPLTDSHREFITIAHSVLVELFLTVSLPQNVRLYQYVDNILIGGDFPKKIGEAATALWEALHKAEVEIPSGTCQGARREVKFRGT